MNQLKEMSFPFKLILSNKYMMLLTFATKRILLSIN